MMNQHTQRRQPANRNQRLFKAQRPRFSPRFHAMQTDLFRDSILAQAEWYAEREFGRFSIESDSQDHGWMQ